MLSHNTACVIAKQKSHNYRRQLSGNRLAIIFVNGIIFRVNDDNFCLVVTNSVIFEIFWIEKNWTKKLLFTLEAQKYKSCTSNIE